MSGIKQGSDATTQHSHQTSSSGDESNCFTLAFEWVKHIIWCKVQNVIRAPRRKQVSLHSLRHLVPFQEPTLFHFSQSLFSRTLSYREYIEWSSGRNSTLLALALIFQNPFRRPSVTQKTLIKHGQFSIHGAQHKQTMNQKGCLPWRGWQFRERTTWVHHS